MSSNIKLIDAIDLINCNRFDIIMKYKFVEMVEKELDLDFIEEYYLKTIEAFSEGLYIEDDGTNRKNKPKDFIDIFYQLIKSIKQKGVDSSISIIPVNKSGIAINGAHRIAIAAYFNQKVPVEIVDEDVNYDYKFFKERLLDEEVLDYMALEYAKLKKNIYIACIWPASDYQKNKRKIMNIFEKNTDIVYKKDVKLNYEGLTSFIQQIYSHQEWTGNIKNKFKGAYSKSRDCFYPDKPIVSLLFECDSFDKVLHIKEEIRSICKIDKHSIHITDNKLETIQIAKILYNKNSIDLLNRGDHYKYPKFYDKLSKFKEEIFKSNISLDDVIIDSSSIMSLYGLREGSDIDYLKINEDINILDNDIWENHEEQLKYYKLSKKQLILNPRNYLVYLDMKFITLDVLAKFKGNRLENKDLLDKELITEFQKEINSFKMKRLKFESTLKKKIRLIKTILIRVIKNILKSIGLFDQLKLLLKKFN